LGKSVATTPAKKLFVAVVGAVAVIILAIVLLKPKSEQAQNTPPDSESAYTDASGQAIVVLEPSQTNAIKIESLGTAVFVTEEAAVGSIDYNEDRAVQVFTPYQGRIINTFANLGDDVKKGQKLFTVDSPDLVQAESTLIAAVATFNLTSNELARAKSLSGTNGISAREFEQATSDAQTAQGALKAAQDALHVFGKTDGDIQKIETTRNVDATLIVRSPLTGRVTARNAQPGLLVQPGNAPAPYAVADLSSKWMVANVSESGSPLLRQGQPVEAKVMAYPGRTFDGKISQLGTAVDPNTHRVMVRCDINDTNDELRPGMMANFTIQVGEPEESVAIPMNGVVRNGDGTFAAWVTTDRLHFTQRMVKLGPQRDGQYQVLEGLQRGELAVTDGAVFISNILYAPPSD
jgi:cobalt-zinc-cadmium efflux system membrane fusion protein